MPPCETARAASAGPAPRLGRGARSKRRTRAFRRARASMRARISRQEGAEDVAGEELGGGGGALERSRLHLDGMHKHLLDEGFSARIALPRLAFPRSGQRLGRRRRAVCAVCADRQEDADKVGLVRVVVGVGRGGRVAQQAVERLALERRDHLLELGVEIDLDIVEIAGIERLGRHRGRRRDFQRHLQRCHHLLGHCVFFARERSG
eukprot:2055562-Pleurochrysis_carterae.AAC.2